MKGNGFDFLAPHYWWLEKASFTNQLQRTRVAHLSRLAGSRRALILGEGDGRFLREFLSSNQQADVVVIDSSEGMARLAKKEVARIPGGLSRVRFHVEDALRWNYPPGAFDLVVANFFLDCFQKSELALLIPLLRQALAPQGLLLVGDFHLPDRPWKRLPAWLALQSMYGFFALFTPITARCLADPSHCLRENGFTPVQEERFLGGFLRSSLWRRGTE